MNAPLDLTNLDPALHRRQQCVTVTVEGILEPADLQAFLVPSQVPTQIRETDLKQIKERHHAVARLLASGMTVSLVASITRYTPGNIHILKNNPAMQELIGFYRAQHSNAAQAVAERLKTVALDATEKLAEAMERDELSERGLLSLAKLGLDRSGHGPSSSHHVHQETHLVDHAELARLNREARRESAQDIVPLQAQLPSPDAGRQVEPQAEPDEGEAL